MTLPTAEINDHNFCVNNVFVATTTQQTMSIFNAIKRAVPDALINIRDSSLGKMSSFKFEVSNKNETVSFETHNSRPFLFRIKTDITEIDKSSLISKIVKLNDNDVYCKNKINEIIDAFNDLNIIQDMYSKFNNVTDVCFTKQNNEDKLVFSDTTDSIRTVGKVHYKPLSEDCGLSVGITYYCHTAIYDNDKLCNVYQLNIDNSTIMIDSINLEMKIMKDRKNAFHMEYLKDDETAEAFDETMVEDVFNSILTKRVAKILSIDYVDNEIYSYEELKDSFKLLEMVDI